MKGLEFARCWYDLQTLEGPTFSLPFKRKKEVQDGE